MIKNKKLSLSLVNAFLLISFMLLLVSGIIISVYFTTQKVVDYNIKQYVKQTNNITKIILDAEQKNLNDFTLEASHIIEQNGFEDEEFVNDIISITSIENIDLIFLKSDDKIVDYSNSLFDTQSIINEIKKNNFSQDNKIIKVTLKDENYIILLCVKKTIDKITGRVVGELFTGKLLNDNLHILHKIKEKAQLEDVHIYFDNNLIATTSKNKILDMSIFKERDIVQKRDSLFLNKKLKLYDNEELDIVFIAKNSTFELLRDDFTKTGYVLLFFIIYLFAVLYFFSNKFIINPFSKLLIFAQKAKDEKNVVYTETYVKEFDDFAVNLKDIIDELIEIKEQYSRAIEGVEDGFFDFELAEKKLFLSNRFLNMLGFNNKDNIDKKNLFKKSIYKSDYFKTLRKLINHIKGNNNFYEDSYRFLCKDGTYKWIRVRAKAFFTDDGKLIRITGFHTDIENLVKLQNDNMKKEQMLYHQNKLASMGEMIGNIAHQWRQPLNIISTIVSNQIIKLELGTSNKKDTLDDLKQLDDTVQYLSTIIDKFRYFFNPNKEIEEFYIDEAIKDNLELIGASYNISNIDLIFDMEKIKVSGFKFELLQVLINIINNAKDALLEKLDSFEKKLVFIEAKKQNDFLLIRIYDNANGIDEKVKDKIYEPYFTTKHQSQGTGLGLYMSSEIIKKHFNGEIQNKTIEFEYEGNKYKGEEFIIKILVD